MTGVSTVPPSQIPLCPHPRRDGVCMLPHAQFTVSRPRRITPLLLSRYHGVRFFGVPGVTRNQMKMLHPLISTSYALGSPAEKKNSPVCAFWGGLRCTYKIHLGYSKKKVRNTG